MMGGRFFASLENDYGLVEAARGDENGVAPVGWELHTSGVPTSAPHRGYRVTPVRRCAGKTMWGIVRAVLVVMTVGVRRYGGICPAPDGDPQTSMRPKPTA